MGRGEIEVELWGRYGVCSIGIGFRREEDKDS